MLNVLLTVIATASCLPARLMQRSDRAKRAVERVRFQGRNPEHRYNAWHSSKPSPQGRLAAAGQEVEKFDATGAFLTGSKINDIVSQRGPTPCLWI